MSTVSVLHALINEAINKEFGISDKKILNFIYGSFFSRRTHKHYAGYKSYSRDALAKVFGRNNFTTLNSLHGLFDLLPYSKRYGYTRGLKHSTKLVSIFNTAINSIDPTEEEKHESFTRLGGIYTKDFIGNQAKFTSKILQAAKVNTVALHKMSQIIPQGSEEEIREQQLIKIQSALMRAVALDGSKIKRGWIIQRYRQIKTGRVYSSGMSLQNCCRSVRYAALSGLHSFDISNCHWAILAQLSTVKTPHVDDYLKTKAATRKALSSQLGLSLDDVKTILISIIYGASLPPAKVVFNSVKLKDDKYLLPAIAGLCKTEEVYTRVLSNDIIKGLSSDIKRAGKELIENSIDKSGKYAGQLVNAMRIVCHESEQSKQLSHILQGYEVKCLEAVTTITGTDTAALLHDGFVTYSSYNKEVFEQAIFNHTGLKLTIDYEVVKSFLCDVSNQPIDLASVDDNESEIDSPCTLSKESVLSLALCPHLTLSKCTLHSQVILNQTSIMPLTSKQTTPNLDNVKFAAKLR